MPEFDEGPVPKMSYTLWVINSLGWPNLHLLLCVTIVAFAMVTWLSRCGHGPARPVAILLLIPLPLLVGYLISLGATIHWLSAAASGSENAFMTAQLVSQSLLSITISATCTLPTSIFGLMALLKSEPPAMHPKNG